MTGPTDPASVVTAVYEARSKDDLDTVQQLLHPDVVWREHEGEAGYAGTHVGRSAVLDGMLASALNATDGTFTVRLEAVIGFGPVLAAALVQWSAVRDGRPMSGREIGAYRVHGGQIVEASFLLEDPEATDAFFADVP